MTNLSLKNIPLAIALAAALGSSFAMPVQAAPQDRDINWNSNRYDSNRYNNNRHDNGRYDNGRYDNSRNRGWERRAAPHYNAVDDRRWRQGRWMQTRYNGRYGWWWVVGNDWRYYNAPVYPYPVNPYASEVVYAPPVVVAPPPRPSPGINFVFPLDFN